MSWETFNEEGFRTLHDVQSFRGVRNPARSQNARFSLAHRLAATFPGAGNASRKPETTVTEATTAGRGDNCGEVHNGRGRVGPRGLNRPPCSTKSSSARGRWRAPVPRPWCFRHSHPDGDYAPVVPVDRVSVTTSHGG